MIHFDLPPRRYHACLIYVAFQQGGPSLKKLADLLTEAKFAPCRGRDRLKHCSSHLPATRLIQHCGRDDLAHAPKGTAENPPGEGESGC